MLIILKIEAPNDDNGNPRRGWIVRETVDPTVKQPYQHLPMGTLPGPVEHFAKDPVYVDEGYEGKGSLQRFINGREYVSMGSIPVSTRVFNDFRRGLRWGGM